MMNQQRPAVSIIIPFYNEAQGVESILKETRAANPFAEIVAVNDGSGDDTANLIRKFPDVRLISFPRNLGQSAALYAGLRASRGEYCVLMDGDGQNHPGDIPGLIALAREYDVVCGYRVDRKDSLRVRLASRIANTIRQWVTKDGIRDAGCTLKVIRRCHLRYLIPFNQMQCYMVAMLRRANLRIVESPVRHRPRLFGRSNYTVLGRALHGVRDLFGIHWLLAREIVWPREVDIFQDGEGACEEAEVGDD
jgi:dolichol-phosphate mannosyltransferase